MRSLLTLAVLLVGCGAFTEPPDPGPCPLSNVPGLVDGSRTNPYPSVHLMADEGGGCHVALRASEVPVGDGDLLEVRGIDRLDGFSPAGTAVFVPGVAIDPSSLPPLDDPARSLEPGSAVQLWDLDAGERVPCFAELDAYPDQPEEARALLIRPLRALPFGSHAAVVLTDRLELAGGGSFESPPAFAAIRDRQEDESEPGPAHYELLVHRLEALGLDRTQIRFAWDYPVASEERITAPLDRVVASMREALPLDVGVSPSVQITESLDSDAGDDLPPGLWREVRGSVRLPRYLWDDDPAGQDHDTGLFRLDDDGLPERNGSGEVFFTLVVPESLRGRPAGEAPVLVFGHGIFSAPAAYLTPGDDRNGVIGLCQRLGAICLGARWRGLTTSDAGDAVRVATNLGRFPLLTDKLVQGVADQLAMARLARTDFIERGFLSASDGGSLVDPSRVLYYGISLGGIEGATFLATSEVVHTGALHVPGAVWATMLERSSDWEPFETFVVQHQPDAARRQLFYAMTQLLWDPVDPINYAAPLRDAVVLWATSEGDEQVPNFTAETLMRTIGVPRVTPGIRPVFGLQDVPAPLPPGSRGLFQYDTGLPRPPPGNRPAPVSGAHDGIRRTPELLEQLAAFFDPAAEGTIIAPCDGPCVLPDGR